MNKWARLLSKSLLVLAAALSLAGCIVIAQPTVSSYEGVWTGRGHQIDPFSQWSMKLVIKGQDVLMTYPDKDYQCTASWTYEGRCGAALLFREQVRQGKERCQDGSLVVVTRMHDRRLRVEYFFPDDDFLAVGYLSPNP
jgi:hypothetical protein